MPATTPPARVDISRVSAVSLFPVIVETFRIDNHAELDAALMAEIAGWRREDEGMKISNVSGWHSPMSLFLREEPALRRLCAALSGCGREAVKRYWNQFDPAVHGLTAVGWVNVNPKGGMNSPHAHPDCHLSGVYYVRAPRAAHDMRSGTLNFLNPAGGGNPSPGFAQKVLLTQHAINPEPGQIVIFPSYLMHWVYPNLSDEERVTIAFNLTVDDAALLPSTDPRRAISD